MPMEGLERPFGEIALTLLAAALVGTAGTWLRQPLVVSFIVVGILMGPAGTGLMAHHDQIALLGSIGIALLLFVVGLKLDVQTIGTLGPVARGSLSDARFFVRPGTKPGMQAERIGRRWPRKLSGTDVASVM